MFTVSLLGPGEVVLILIAVVGVGFKLFSPVYAVAFIAGVYLVIYLRFKSINSYWKNRGVPGPEGILFFGSMLDLVKDIYEYDRRNLEKYGSFYGAMMKGCPDFVTTDVDMIQKVMVQEFDCFPNQSNFVFSTYSDRSLFNKMLNIQKDDDWRRIRRKITPALTSLQLKQLIPGMVLCVEELDRYLDDKYADKDVDVPLKDVYSKLTLNVIGRTVFADDFNTFSTDVDTPLLANARLVFGSDLGSKSILLAIVFPFFCGLYEKLTGNLVVKNDVNDFFLELLDKVVDDRMADPDAKNKYKDAVQLLLNAMEDESFDSRQLDADLVSDNVQKSATHQKVTKMEIMAQMLIFLAAGFETTASTLHFITYILSREQEIQERLRDEVIDVMGDDPSSEVTMENLQKLTYMDQVIKETLRMYSPASRTNRMCSKKTTINGITFEPGTSVSISPLAVHYSSQYYKDPLVFDPERFSKEEQAKRHPMAFLAFGGGPRMCVGMRFSEFEMKSALALVIRKYRFLPSADMPGLPVPIVTPGLLRPKMELKCRIQRI